MVTQEQIDQQWDDEGVIPDTINPDTDYLIDRMTCETLETVDPRPGEWILDIGCGRALDLLSLEPKGATLFGFDGSHIMIGRAATNFSKRGVPLRLVCGSAENLPYADQSFDKIFCKGAIDHFYDPGQALREMIRVLKPDGRVIIAVANFNNLGFRIAKLYDRIYKVIRDKRISGSHMWDKPEDHTYKFNRSFLLNILPRDVRIDRDFGISLFWGFPKWGRFLKSLPEKTAKRILQTMDRIAHKCPNLADVLVVRIERVSMGGEKSFET
ncbi:MAG: class I SAM-dependent methyltransferase [Deltaproteobacteria bacterium]|nr:class I SAM-dependent methyltransferase [Deltaproteobacteria bacterium]